MNDKALLAEMEGNLRLANSMLYLEGKTVAFVCDDTLFIKPTAGALALLPDTERGPAYPGSKDYIIGSEVLDDPDLCARVLRVVAAESLPPKPKKPSENSMSCSKPASRDVK